MYYYDDGESGVGGPTNFLPPGAEGGGGGAGSGDDGRRATALRIAKSVNSNASLNECEKLARFAGELAALNTSNSKFVSLFQAITPQANTAAWMFMAGGVEWDTGAEFFGGAWIHLTMAIKHSTRIAMGARPTILIKVIISQLIFSLVFEEVRHLLISLDIFEI